MTKYKVSIIGDDNFSTYSLFREKVNDFIQDKIPNVIMRSNGNKNIDLLCKRFCQEYNLEALHLKKTEDFYTMIDVVAESDIVIFFWDGRDLVIRKLMSIAAEIEQETQLVTHVVYYNTIPLSVVEAFYNENKPISITYIDYSKYGCECRIKEFEEFNSPYSAFIDIEHLFLLKKENFYLSQNRHIYFDVPIKAYILWYNKVGLDIEVKRRSNKELEKMEMPLFCLSRLPFALDEAIDFFPQKVNATYYDKSRYIEGRSMLENNMECQKIAPKINNLDVDFETFIKVFDLYSYNRKFALLLYKKIKDKHMRLIELSDNKLLNEIFFNNGEYIEYVNKPRLAFNYKVVPIKKTYSLSEEDIMNAISYGFDDYI